VRFPDLYVALGEPLNNEVLLTLLDHSHYNAFIEAIKNVEIGQLGSPCQNGSEFLQFCVVRNLAAPAGALLSKGFNRIGTTTDQPCSLVMLVIVDFHSLGCCPKSVELTDPRGRGTAFHDVMKSSLAADIWTVPRDYGACLRLLLEYLPDLQKRQVL
jgi:hypothetical protein